MGQIKVGNRGGSEECDGRHQEQRRIEPTAGAVIFLDMIAQPAEQKGGAQHEQCVGDDCTRDRCLHQHVLARSKIRSYVSEWERSSIEKQSRSLILALADRLDQLGRNRPPEMRTRVCLPRHRPQIRR